MKRAAGFTLLEMLVGLALLGLMTLALFSALRFGTRSWERMEAKSTEVVDFNTVEHVLRREIGRAFPVRVGLASENRIGFEGDGSRLKFFAALPSHFTAGGLSRVELRVERDAQRFDAPTLGTLMLRHALQEGTETDLPEGDETTASRLLRGVESFKLSYFGRDSDTAEASWKEAWPPGARFPQLVRVRLTLAGVATPREFIIPVRIAEEAGCYQASFQRACGPRR